MKPKFKYRRIIKYLNSKEESKYNNLDCIFKLYITEQLQGKLKKYNFSKIEYFSQIRKNKNYLQINFWYFNLVVTIEFGEDAFDYYIYLPGSSAIQVDENIVKSDYPNNFNITQFIDDVYIELKNDNRLVK